MKVYVVVSGEKGDSSSIVDVRLCYEEARIAALLVEPAFGPWVLEKESDPKMCQSGDVLICWESSCDYVEVQVWEAK